MSLKSKLSSVFTLAFAVAAFGVVVSAQETTPAPKDDTQKMERHGRRGGERGLRGDRRGGHDGMRGGHGMRGGMFGLRGIELTDAQKEQVRQIHEANKPNEALMAELKSFREARKSGGELTATQKDRIKSIRGEMQAKRESVHQQILGILTTEQRQQIETRKADMEKRREEMKQRRQEFRQKREAAKPAVKTTDDN